MPASIAVGCVTAIAEPEPDPEADADPDPVSATSAEPEPEPEPEPDACFFVATITTTNARTALNNPAAIKIAPFAPRFRITVALGLTVAVGALRAAPMLGIAAGVCPAWPA
jgi:hypothetical protein